MISQPLQDRLAKLTAIYRPLAASNPAALRTITLAEIPEMVYNSNAIENSTLTLQDTEDILLYNQVKKDHDIREIFEAKNLARILEILTESPRQPLTVELILSLHRILLTGINDRVAGRFRSGDEWVRVGSHIGASPALTNQLVYQLVENYHQNDHRDFLSKIAYFHAELETIHPFCDGNGRIGRVLINQQLASLGLPPIIIREKSKREDYYPLFSEYRRTGSTSGFEELFALLLLEALHKRIAILSGQPLLPLGDWAKANNISPSVANNKAHRQTIPAFRQGNKWHISATAQDTDEIDLV